MSLRPLLVTAHLAGTLAGEPPHLDSLLLDCMLRCTKKPVDRGKIDRALPPPNQDELPCPLGKVWLGEWLVYQCSAPVLPKVGAETVNHYCKRLATETAELIAPEQRRIISTTNSWTKSYRLPLRVRRVECVRWACFGDRREVLKLLKHQSAIGKKVSQGYGRVAKWTAEECAADWSWFATHSAGQVLMRPLPRTIDGREWLPKDLLGSRLDYGACCPPYWHPARYCELVLPC